MNRIKYIAFLVGAMIMVPVASAQNDSTSLNDNPLVAITGREDTIEQRRWLGL